MTDWLVTATDYDDAWTEWFSETVQAETIDQAYREAEKIADQREQGSRFRGCDFLWRVKAKALPKSEHVVTYPSNHPLLSAGALVPSTATAYQSERRTALV